MKSRGTDSPIAVARRTSSQSNNTISSPPSRQPSRSSRQPPLRIPYTTRTILSPPPPPPNCPLPPRPPSVLDLQPVLDSWPQHSSASAVPSMPLVVPSANDYNRLSRTSWISFDDEDIEDPEASSVGMVPIILDGPKMSSVGMVPIILDGPDWPAAAATTSSSGVAGRREDNGERASVKSALSRGVRLRREIKGSIDSTISSFSKASSSAYTPSVSTSRTSSMATTSRTSISTYANSINTKRSISRRDAGPPLIQSPQPSPRASSPSKMRQSKPKSVDVMEVDLKQFHCNATKALEAPAIKSKKKVVQKGKTGQERKESEGSAKETGKGSRRSVLGSWWQKRSG
jgi:hypothetical protein